MMEKAANLFPNKQKMNFMTDFSPNTQSRPNRTFGQFNHLSELA